MKNIFCEKITTYIQKIEMIMGIIVLCVVSLISCKMPEIMEEETTTKKHEQIHSNSMTVIIDPGHGGVDPGKIGITGILEKDLNLQISLKLRDKLMEKGYNVVMTREQDAGLYNENDSNKKRSDMQKRCGIINELAKKDEKIITISIHQNSYTSESVRGPQMFYYSKSEQGMKLANILQDEINTYLDIEKKREIKSNDNYYMLAKTKSPTVIVECGFLSNREEALQLAEDTYQNSLVEGISIGVEKYYEEIAKGGMKKYTQRD